MSRHLQVAKMKSLEKRLQIKNDFARSKAKSKSDNRQCDSKIEDSFEVDAQKCTKRLQIFLVFYNLDSETVKKNPENTGILKEVPLTQYSVMSRHLHLGTQDYYSEHVCKSRWKRNLSERRNVKMNAKQEKDLPFLPSFSSSVPLTKGTSSISPENMSTSGHVV